MINEHNIKINENALYLRFKTLSILWRIYTPKTKDNGFARYGSKQQKYIMLNYFQPKIDVK